MNNTNDSIRKNFDLPELITSLLYASAISAMLSFSMSMNHTNISFTPIFNTFLVILLVFADWNNRILVPLHFPQEDLEVQRKPFFTSLKLLSEIISMVLLVMFYSYLIKGNYRIEKTINIYFLFALYLSACGAWNILMIRIMSGINLIPLLISIVKGNVFDLPDLHKYTKNFKNDIQNKERKLHKSYVENIGETAAETKRNLRIYIKGNRRLLINVNFARTLAQFVGNHISWISFWVSILLILFTFDLIKYVSVIEFILDSLQLSISSILIKMIFLFFLIITLLIFMFFIDLNSVIRKKYFGLSILSFFIVFYSCFSVYYLIYVMLIQQILIGLLIEYITDSKYNLDGVIR